MRYPLHAKPFLMITLLIASVIFPQMALTTTFDIRGVNFKPSLPLDGGSFVGAVAEPSTDSMAILQQAADTLNAYPKMRVKVVGFTDDKECSGSDCIQLSFRRAKYVKDWLFTHGVSIQQLYGPEGHGCAEPINDNSVESGRAQNRRAELQIISY